MNSLIFKGNFGTIFPNSQLRKIFVSCFNKIFLTITFYVIDLSRNEKTKAT